MSPLDAMQLLADGARKSEMMDARWNFPSHASILECCGGVSATPTLLRRQSEMMAALGTSLIFECLRKAMTNRISL